MKLKKIFEPQKGFEDIVPEILHTFDNHPEEENVELQDASENWYQITRFDMQVYQMITDSNLKNIFLGLLFAYQTYRSKDTPNFFVGELMAFCNDIRLQERANYNKELVEGYFAQNQ